MSRLIWLFNYIKKEISTCSIVLLFFYQFAPTVLELSPLAIIMSASLDLGPPNQTPFSLFFTSQFQTPTQWPPKETNLEGKVAIVTGSTSGLGLEASRQLLTYGLSCLIMAVRSRNKGEQVAMTFRTEFPTANIQVWPLEMESYDSIQALARRAESELRRLDIVILNAGVQAADFTTIAETGHEKLIQVNYLSTMLLAILLLPVLKDRSVKGRPGRLTVVSSGTARGAVLSGPEGAPILASLDDTSRPWKPVERYAASKLLGHLFITDLAQQVSPDDVVVNLVDPGLVKDTALQSFAPKVVVALFYVFKAIFGRSLTAGASTYVDAVAVKDRTSHGSLISNWKISP
jgi:NAD(P)-dependent dehydrogenase (short-subunit alcohol dehydrogenase family)